MRGNAKRKGLAGWSQAFVSIGAQGQNRPIRQERIGTAEGWPEGRNPGMDFVTTGSVIFNRTHISQDQ
jgi:hypothetical protein